MLFLTFPVSSIILDFLIQFVASWDLHVKKKNTRCCLRIWSKLSILEGSIAKIPTFMSKEHVWCLKRCLCRQLSRFWNKARDSEPTMTGVSFSHTKSFVTQPLMSVSNPPPSQSCSEIELNEFLWLRVRRIETEKNRKWEVRRIRSYASQWFGGFCHISLPVVEKR